MQTDPEVGMRVVWNGRVGEITQLSSVAYADPPEGIVYALFAVALGEIELDVCDVCGEYDENLDIDYNAHPGARRPCATCDAREERHANEYNGPDTWAESDGER